MANFSYGIGKGLREPCSPSRSTNVFGADLNVPSAADWNCLPALVSPTASFDLSGISKNHEVVVALLNIDGIGGLDCQVTFRWYREYDHKLLYQYTRSKGKLWWNWFYVYSYIGYTDWEINDNGVYSVEVIVSGDISYSRTIYFDVSGIPEEPAIPTVPSGFGVSVVDALNSVSSWFYSIYMECLSSGPPLWWLAGFFYNLSLLFNTLAWGASDFFTWVYGIAARVEDILSWDSIWGLILRYIPNLEDIRDWFYYWRDWVLQSVGEWWLSTYSTVMGWIQEAKDLGTILFNQVNAGLTALRSEWDGFKGRIPTIEQVIYWWGGWSGNVLAMVDTWWDSRVHDVQDLIDSSFVARNSLWEGWQDIRSQVLSFFDNPVEFIWNRFIDWFLGPEV